AAIRVCTSLSKRGGVLTFAPLSKGTLMIKLARACLCVAGALLSVAANADDTVKLNIDAGKPGAKIERHIFGQFAEHLGRGVYEGVWVGPDSKIPNTRGIRNAVVAALTAIKVTSVRWPGGCFADEYHWKNGIGPRDKRPPTLDPKPGGSHDS